MRVERNQLYYGGAAACTVGILLIGLRRLRVTQSSNAEVAGGIFFLAGTGGLFWHAHTEAPPTNPQNKADPFAVIEPLIPESFEEAEWTFHLIDRYARQHYSAEEERLDEHTLILPQGESNQEFQQALREREIRQVVTLGQATDWWTGCLVDNQGDPGKIGIGDQPVHTLERIHSVDLSIEHLEELLKAIKPEQLTAIHCNEVGMAETFLAMRTMQQVAKTTLKEITRIVWDLRSKRAHAVATPRQFDLLCKWAQHLNQPPPPEEEVQKKTCDPDTKTPWEKMVEALVRSRVKVSDYLTRSEIAAQEFTADVRQKLVQAGVGDTFFQNFGLE